MSVTISLFANRSDPLVMGKTLDEVGDTSYVGNFRDEVDVVAPVVQIQTNVLPDFDYVYIREFERYYFVDSIVSVAYNLWELGLRVDVLESFKKSISKFSGIIERNEFESNPLIEDSAQVFLPGYDVEEIDGEIQIWDEPFVPESEFKKQKRYVIMGTTLSTGTGGD